ncbi:MAG: RHS repeat-associated core domain-containing protein [Candidatus Woesearchaeota archaeon]|nr:MAG: RHS repeat-associated core domain-containing protein [Candidatus Woesearchaeota archaeon]
MGRFVVFPLVVGLVALVGVLLLFVGRFDFDGSGRAFSVDVLSPSSDVDVSDELVVGKSHVDASSVGDDPLDGSFSKEVVDDVVVKEDGVGVVKNDVVQNDVVKDVVDSLDSDDGVVDDGFGFDDVVVGDRGLSFPVVTRFVPGVGELRNGKLSFRHSDRLSSVRLKTAANTAQVTGEFLSLPFGQELVSTNSRLSFATEKELDESGLYFFGARYYDPNIGRFTGVDPVRSNHAYSYVGNNPMNKVDPDGRADLLARSTMSSSHDYQDPIDNYVPLSIRAATEDETMLTFAGELTPETQRVVDLTLDFAGVCGLTSSVCKVGNFIYKGIPGDRVESVFEEGVRSINSRSGKISNDYLRSLSKEELADLGVKHSFTVHFGDLSSWTWNEAYARELADMSDGVVLRVSLDDLRANNIPFDVTDYDNLLSEGSGLSPVMKRSIADQIDKAEIGTGDVPSAIFDVSYVPENRLRSNMMMASPIEGGRLMPGWFFE